MSGIKKAISGKGGVGKTTICVIWTHLFAEEGFKVIAVNANPDADLSSVFDLSSAQSPEPLIHMKSLVVECTGTGKDAVIGWKIEKQQLMECFSEMYNSGMYN
ncbi:MAG: nucleotide-binding protein [Planctomycetota bacterium]